MQFWNKYPFVRLTLSLILGILCSSHFISWWNHSYITLILLLVVVGSSSLLTKKIGYYKLRYFNGVFILLTLFYLGGMLRLAKYHDYPADHYTNQPVVDFFEGRIVSSALERTNHTRYELKLKRGFFNDSVINLSGKIHLYVKKDSSIFFKDYGDQVYVKGSYFEIPGPKNPSEFDYRAYLSKQSIYSQSFVTEEDVKVIGNQPANALIHLAFQLRTHFTNIIDRNIKSERENAISKALLLGIKHHLDNDLKRSYSSVGAMHVLAVSGLHVGIIYLVLQFLLGGIKKTAIGKRIVGITCILIIWLYALITGFSPSVLRAATMFSVIAIGDMILREGNIYNTLGVSAFAILMFDPHQIYAIGFQLSYAAVFGIAYLYPKLYSLLSFNNKILNKTWSLSCVSISAQIATFPISIYYFHQFPTYFLISNLAVIPAAATMLYTGIAMITFDSIIPIVGSLLGKILQFVISLLNELIFLIEQLPFSLIDWIHIDLLELFLLYGILITLLSGFHFRSFYTLIFSTFIILILCGWRVKSNIDQSKRKQLIFYESRGNTLIDHINGHQATLFTDNIPPEWKSLSTAANGHRLASFAQPIKNSTQSFDQSIHFKSFDSFTTGFIAGQKILIMDSSTFHLFFEKPIHVDILTIENEAVKSLKWLKNNFYFNHLVIGNKNSYAYSKRMERQAKKLNIDIHSLKLNGAFILDLTRD